MQKQHDRRAIKNRDHFTEQEKRSRISSEKTVGKFLLLCYKFWHVKADYQLEKNPVLLITAARVLLLPMCLTT